MKLANMAAATVALLCGFAVGHYEPYPIPQIKAAFHSPVVQPSEQDTTFFRLRTPLFEAFSPQTQIVMAGDSLTGFVEWRDLFPGLSIANRGIGSDTAEGLLSRVHQITAMKPQKVFLMIGINDLFSGHSMERITTAYKATIAALHDSQVFVQSTLFVANSPTINARVAELNRAMKAYCAEGICTFLDLDAAICPGGTLPLDMTLDGVHLSAAAYQRWRDTIRPHF